MNRNITSYHSIPINLAASLSMSKMHVILNLAFLLVVLHESTFTCALTLACAFSNTQLHRHRHRHRPPRRSKSPRAATSMLAKRYRPPPGANANANVNFTADASGRGNIKSQFTSLLHDVMLVRNPEELPSLLTTNIHVILSAMSPRDLMEEIIREAVDDNRRDVEPLSEAVDTIVTFAEAFVEQAKAMDDKYKHLLGEIFKLIAPAKNNQIETQDSTPIDDVHMEMELDRLLARENEAFTPGFLRHLEGECERISALKTVTPESAKMLQILRVIQTRVLEELGKDIGEGAIMLGQLLGYDDRAERLAVLDAGLTVRGVEFACELSTLTAEALRGFQAVKDVDPGLVTSIEEIDERIGLFMDKSRFQ